MNLIDILMIFIIALATRLGWQRGFIHSIAGILIWTISILAIFLSSELIARLIEHISDINEPWIRPLGFIVLLAISSRFIYHSFDQCSAKFPEELHRNKINKSAGLLPGLVSGLFYAAVLSLMLRSYPSKITSQEVESSLIASKWNNYTGNRHNVIDSTLNKLGYYFGRSITIYPKEKEIISLPFGSTTGIERKDLEKEMLSMVNQERERNGLNFLQFDEELSNAARIHSADMLKRAYFSHYSPEGKNTYDRLKIEGIEYRLAGENLALAENTMQAHDGLMSSPVHKANILNKTFTHIGIGVMDAGHHGLMITQMFRN